MPILVVEDTPEVRDLLQDLLQEAGYSVVLAEDGLKAVGLLDSARPRLVLLDLSLPGMDGAAVLRWMAANRQTRGIPVIVVSASPKIIPAEARAQVKGVMDKPFELDDLLARVRTAVSRATA